jgi:6-phosphogluconolactonase
MTRLTTLADGEAVAGRAALEIARDLDSARRARGELKDWDGIEVWFADERCVGPEDAQSNYRLARETLLTAAGVPDERVHRMEGELGPEAGAERYAQALRERVPAQSDGPAPAAGEIGQTAAAPPALDVVVLGIGPDGHIASLFPGAPTLQADAGAVCLAVHDSPKPPPERITLSLHVLRAARACVLLATSASKSDAVAAMLAAPSPHVPASLLRRGRLSVIVDDAAAPPPPNA